VIARIPCVEIRRDFRAKCSGTRAAKELRMANGGWLLGAVSVVAVAALVGCGDASVGDDRQGYVPYDTQSSAQPTDPTATQNGAAADPTNGGTSGGASSGSNGGGTTNNGATDAGAPGFTSDAGSAPADAGTTSTGNTTSAAGAFAGAPAYVQTTGTSTIRSSHPFAGNNPVKQACLDCHSFAAGGSVFLDAAGTMPAANIEIRMIDTNGVAKSSYTDANGNFFFPSGTIAGPAKVGVRDATATHLMSGGVSNGNCSSSSCHGGSQGVIHLN
jgi:hypothetical protein